MIIDGGRYSAAPVSVICGGGRRIGHRWQDGRGSGSGELGQLMVLGIQDGIQTTAAADAVMVVQAGGGRRMSPVQLENVADCEAPWTLVHRGALHAVQQSEKDINSSECVSKTDSMGMGIISGTAIMLGKDIGTKSIVDEIVFVCGPTNCLNLVGSARRNQN